MKTKARSRARGNLALAAIAALLVGSVVGAGALILSVSGREAPLREAEVDLAELNSLSSALLAHPRNVVDRGAAAKSDLVVNAELEGAAVAAARQADRNWGTPTSERLLAQVRRNAALSRRTIDLVAAGDVAAARRVFPELAPATERLQTDLSSARRELSGDIDAVHRDASIGVFAILGVLAGAFVLAMLGFGAWRRRRVREEAEQQALRESEQRLRALVRHGSDLITVVEPDTTVLYEAGAVKSVLGYDADEMEGRKLSEWLHPDDVPTLVSLCATANGGGAARELRFRQRDGDLKTCEARATSLLGDELWNGIVLNVWDVSERKQLEERLRHQAFHDNLTGLANRALFRDRLEHALIRGERVGQTVTVLLIDLDDFKSINDSLGHVAGDGLIGEMAQRLSEAMRAADTIARLGGDEFAVILDQSASLEDDERAVQRLLAAIAEPVRLGDWTFPVTASVGIARGTPGEASADRLIRDADLAMYSAKGSSKGCYAVYRPDMHIATEGRLQLKADLVSALEAGDQLVLRYQPVVSLRGGRIVGLEALLRWNHPTRGQIGPEEFIPLAEETGAIVPIGRWVLREACRQGQAWDSDSDSDLLISVNVSARQLQTSAFAADVRRALTDSGLRPERLVLEVTETALMKNVDLATEVLRAVKRLGVQIAIDDFGTGYSSLSQLERLPVDILKVDREFAGTPEDRAEHARLLRAVMEIGDSLHLSTIAEGIETPEQLEEMRSLHYALGQGFLLSRPIPATAVDALLAGERARAAETPQEAGHAAGGSEQGSS